MVTLICKISPHLVNSISVYTLGKQLLRSKFAELITDRAGIQIPILLIEIPHFLHSMVSQRKTNKFLI